MASTNANTKHTFAERTAGGAPAAQMTKEQALRRSVLSCLLWEDEFYEDGVTVAERIRALALELPAVTVAKLAIEAREDAKLRHVPLWLLVALCRTGSGSSLVSETITRVIQRADELSELLALYWKANGEDATLSAQLKLGLAGAFEKFDAYQLAKYDRARDVRLRDVLFLAHAKPVNDERAALYKSLVDETLDSPDTWEVAMSGGGDKRAEFTRLLETGKLGYLALLRNLRNMAQAGVDEKLIRSAILARRGADRVLPFRFLTAAKHAKRFEDVLEEAMFATIAAGPKLAGKTVIITDTSGSMGQTLSGNSELRRLDAANALTAVLREQCAQAVVYATAGNDYTCKHATMLIPTARRGFGLIEALDIDNTRQRIGGGGIFLRQVMDHVQPLEPDADRIVVITDEQDTGRENPRSVKPYARSNYMINVASARNGIGYALWTHIDGFSESAVRYIQAAERQGVIDGVGADNRPAR